MDNDSWDVELSGAFQTIYVLWMQIWRSVTTQDFGSHKIMSESQILDIDLGFILFEFNFVIVYQFFI